VDDIAFERKKIEKIIKKQYESEKYYLEWAIFENGLGAIKHLADPDSLQPHLIFTDINMETFVDENEAALDLTAGVEFAKIISKNSEIQNNSIYKYILTELNKLKYKKESNLCSTNIKPFDGIIFAFTSKSESIAANDRLLFKKIYNKIDLNCLKKIIADNEIQIDALLEEY
jgi:CheY-like chemotaxis protein